jgi:hypothetical protein
MYELMELSDQEYVDIYATRAKELRTARPTGGVDADRSVDSEVTAVPAA